MSAILTINEVLSPKNFTRNENQICAQLGNDTLTTKVLKQVCYWYSPTGNGKPKLREKLYGVLYLAKSCKEMARELGLTYHQVRRAYRKLRRLGLIRTIIRKFKGTPMHHIFLTCSPWGTPPVELFPEVQEAPASEEPKINDSADLPSSSPPNPAETMDLSFKTNELVLLNNSDLSFKANDSVPQLSTQMSTPVPQPPQSGGGTIASHEEKEEGEGIVDKVGSFVGNVMRRIQQTADRVQGKPFPYPPEQAAAATTTPENQPSVRMNPRARGESPRQLGVSPRQLAAQASVKNTERRDPQDAWWQRNEEKPSTKHSGGWLVATTQKVRAKVKAGASQEEIQSVVNTRGDES